MAAEDHKRAEFLALAAIHVDAGKIRLRDDDGRGGFGWMVAPEAILQGRAAYLTEDGRDEAFHAHRPRGQAVGRNRLRLIA